MVDFKVDDRLCQRFTNPTTADALKVECACRTFRSLSRAGADDNDLCLVWIH